MNTLDMTPLNCRIPLRLLVALCLSLALLGCAATGGTVVTGQVPANLPKEQAEALVSRVEGKWRAMERWDFAAVYEYTTPNYRSVFSKSMFLKKFGTDLRWQLTGVDILNYDAEAAVASVAVRVMSESTKQTTLASGVGAILDTVDEKWFFIDGVWWNNTK